MTDTRRPTDRGALRPLAWMALLLTGTLLQACGQSQEAAPAGSRLRVYAADVSGGAKLCDAPKVTPADGKTTDATMKVGNSGGWCGLLVHQSGPKPYDAGLLTARPTHGNVLIHEVGDDTRIDYTPDYGFAGSDAFSVKLIPGGATIHVTAIAAAP